MKLIIVESPHKAKTISEFLGPDYKVMASAGHIRDLPASSLGVDEHYRPQYEVSEGKKDLVERLKSAAAGADEVFLATDPDREGEAIAAHLKIALGLKSPQRATWNEITKSAVEKALAAPRELDAKLVSAQEARRVIDRLVGYRVSGPLSNTLSEKASAGRVQTPATRLVVERERAIQAFKPIDHFGVTAKFVTNGFEWAATWKPALPEGQDYMIDKSLAARAAEAKKFTVSQITRAEKQRKAPAPFTTSTLQQAASVSLKYAPDKTMELAQQLFDAGLISYHRTDNPNLSDEAAEMIWAWLRQNSLGDFVPKSRNTWKAKDGAQGAHEAIRPTDFNIITPELSADAGALYALIWKRSVACQMTAQVLDSTHVELTAGEHLFTASGSIETNPGWRKIMDAAAEDEESEAKEQPLPELAEGVEIESTDCEVVSKKTKAPPKYTQASLIKDLEARGIGRPSTFATIIKTIFARGYVEEVKGKLAPTELGCKVVDALAGFGFAAVDYTSALESDFDKIAEGKIDYLSIVSKADGVLTTELKALQSSQPSCECPACGKPMHRKKGPSGFFWGCSAYPECKKTLPDTNGKPDQSTKNCAKCGKAMRRLTAKQGKNTGKQFWACTGYPECKHTEE